VRIAATKQETRRNDSTITNKNVVVDEKQIVSTSHVHESVSPGTTAGVRSAADDSEPGVLTQLGHGAVCGAVVKHDELPRCGKP